MSFGACDLLFPLVVLFIYFLMFKYFLLWAVSVVLSLILDQVSVDKGPESAWVTGGHELLYKVG